MVPGTMVTKVRPTRTGTCRTEFPATQSHLWVFSFFVCASLVSVFLCSFSQVFVLFDLFCPVSPFIYLFIRSVLFMLAAACAALRVLLLKMSFL